MRRLVCFCICSSSDFIMSNIAVAEAAAGGNRSVSARGAVGVRGGERPARRDSSRSRPRRTLAHDVVLVVLAALVHLKRLGGLDHLLWHERGRGPRAALALSAAAEGGGTASARARHGVMEPRRRTRVRMTDALACSPLSACFFARSSCDRACLFCHPTAAHSGQPARRRAIAAREGCEEAAMTRGRARVPRRCLSDAEAAAHHRHDVLRHGKRSAANQRTHSLAVL